MDLLGRAHPTLAFHLLLISAEIINGRSLYWFIIYAFASILLVPLTKQIDVGARYSQSYRSVGYHWLFS